MKVIAIDLDGTILKKIPWQGVHWFGKPQKKVREAMTFLKKHGFEILIHSTRLNPAINEWPLPRLKLNVFDILVEHRIPFDNIFTGTGKPLADFYVDDRAVRFDGDWEATLKEILGRAG